MELLNKVLTDKELGLFFEKSVYLNYSTSGVYLYMDLEDFKQECYIYLSKAPLLNSDHLKGLIVHCIKYCLKNIIKMNNTKGRNNIHSKYTASLDEDLDDECNSIKDYYLGEEDRDDNRIVEEYLEPLKKFNYKWYKAFKMSFDGYKIYEIAKELNITTRTVSRYLVFAKHFLQEYLKNVS